MDWKQVLMGALVPIAVKVLWMLVEQIRDAGLRKLAETVVMWVEEWAKNQTTKPESYVKLSKALIEARSFGARASDTKLVAEIEKAVKKLTQ